MGEPEPVKVRSLADAEAAINSLRANAAELARLIKVLQDVADTRDTPTWRRIVFRADGWPSWGRIHTRLVRGEEVSRAWRPWHRWVRSS